MQHNHPLSWDCRDGSTIKLLLVTKQMSVSPVITSCSSHRRMRFVSPLMHANPTRSDGGCTCMYTYVRVELYIHPSHTIVMVHATANMHACTNECHLLVALLQAHTHFPPPPLSTLVLLCSAPLFVGGQVSAHALVYTHQLHCTCQQPQHPHRHYLRSTQYLKHLQKISHAPAQTEESVAIGTQSGSS